MDDTAYGDTPFSLDNLTTPPVAVRQYHPRLKQMFREAIRSCREKLKITPPIETDGVFCNRTIDGMGGCCPDTLPGTYARIQCPDIQVFNQNAFVYKECTINGTWYENKTTGIQSANYSQCRIGIDTFHEETKHIYIIIGGFSLSITMLLISLTIFFGFRQLRCDRITIHKNLFISYVLTGVAWIFYYALVALDGMVYAFATGKSLIASCYLCGLGFPLILSVAYASVRGNDISNTDCWINESDLQWIMNGPVVLYIVINVMFLINITRLSRTKLREMPEVAQTRKAARAILILIPLLGLQYLLFPVRPEPNSHLKDLYHIVVALAVSSTLQIRRHSNSLWLHVAKSKGSLARLLIVETAGAFVSIIYCFCNVEVIALLRRKYRQHHLMNTRSLRRTSSGHGITTYTMADNIAEAGNTANATQIAGIGVHSRSSQQRPSGLLDIKQHSEEIQLEAFQPRPPTLANPDTS